MKEFTSQTGGRHTYVDDILNLQDLSLAMTSLFDGCDNFIVSGCQISGNQLSPGFVFLNGKIRYCLGSSSITTWPIYIYESNTVEKVSYADSGTKVGRNIFGCAVGSSVPNVPEGLTGAVPQAIQIGQDNSAVRLKDAFFGKYAVVLDGAYQSQYIKNSLNVEGDVTSANGKVTKVFEIETGSNKFTMNYDAEGNFNLQSTLLGKQAYKLSITKDGAFQFYNGSSLLASVDVNGYNLNVPLTATIINGGNIAVTSENIYNYGTVSHNGVLNINMLGYQGGNKYFRDTVIGDGKNTKVVEVNGEHKTCSVLGDFFVKSLNPQALTILHPSLLKTDKTLMSVIDWKDKNNESFGDIGYSSSTDSDLHIHNKVGNIQLKNDVYVFGKLYVNGADVASTYVVKNEFTKQLGLKANSADVYTKTDSDNTFVKRTDSIDVFVNAAGGGETGKLSVRNSIGAASSDEIAKTLKKDELFMDIVRQGLPDSSDLNYYKALEERRRQLCNNIGAAFKTDIRLNPKDTGWIEVSVKNCSLASQLYVRQVGSVVSIQGELHTHHEGLIFTLPLSVDPPRHKIGYSHNKAGNWHCVIDSNSRDCVVDHCSAGCGEYIGFLMTYIV